MDARKNLAQVTSNWHALNRAEISQKHSMFTLIDMIVTPLAKFRLWRLSRVRILLHFIFCLNITQAPNKIKNCFSYDVIVKTKKESEILKLLNKPQILFPGCIGLIHLHTQCTRSSSIYYVKLFTNI